jgi:probable addiction module antidote protein
MTKIKTVKFDVAEFLETPADIAEYLEAAFEDGDAAIISNALGTVARAKGVASIAAKTGLSRESLYRALSNDGNPTLSTLIGVMASFGVRLSVQASAPSKKLTVSRVTKKAPALKRA